MKDKAFQFADFYLDPKQRKFLYQNQPVHLSSRAFEILSLLIQKHGEVVEKEEILKKVWSDSYVEEGNLAVHIYALRRVLDEKRGERKFIETVSGRGYSFVFPVNEVKTDEILLAAEPIDRTNFHLSKNLFDATISLAILPFAIETNDAELEYLASGITQSLIDDVSQIPQLKIMAYSAVKNYRDASLDFQEIGFLLGVDTLILGRISQYKNNLEISVELVRAIDKSYLWGTQYSCQFTDLLQIKKDISLAIVKKLKLRLNTAEETSLTRQQTSSSSAYKSYLKGKHLLDNYQSQKDYEQSLNSALRFFQQAIKEDPNYAPAYVGVARIYHNLNIYSLLSRREAYQKCQTYIQLALNIDKNLSDAHVSNGIVQMILQPNLAEAENSFKRAIDLNPNNSRAYHFYSIASVCTGKFQTALSYQNKALQFDPTSVVFNSGLADRLLCIGNYSEAIVQAEETLELYSWSFHSYFILARAFAELGMYEEALKKCQQASEINSSEEIIFLQAYIYALMGDGKKSQEILNQALEKFDRKFIDFTAVAKVYSVLGEKDKALACLEKALDEGSESLVYLKIDSSFANLREDSRFNAILQKLNLT